MKSVGILNLKGSHSLNLGTPDRGGGGGLPARISFTLSVTQHSGTPGMFAGRVG